MWCSYGKISLRPYAFYLTLWVQTSVSTWGRSHLHDVEDTLWQRAPSAEPDNPITELFPSLHDFHFSNWAADPNELWMTSELLDHPKNSMLQPTLAGHDIHELLQASPNVDEPFCPDFQVESRRIDEEVGSRKRVKPSHGYWYSPQETTSSSLNSRSSRDHGNVESVPKSPSSSGLREVNGSQTPTQDKIFMLLDESEVRTTGHPFRTAQSVADLPASSGGKRSRNKIPFIEKYCQEMLKKLGSNWFRAGQVPWEKLHPTLPILSKLKEGEKGFRAIRISKGGNKKTLQTFVIIESLYENLLWEIYHSHTTRLNLPHEHMMHVGNIFDLLDQEIFNPENGVPLLGISKKTAKGWKEDFSKHQWGETQEILARYFSANPRDKIPVDRLAAYLIRSYYGAQENEEPALRNFQLETTQQTDELQMLMEDSYFRQRYEFIYNLASGDDQLDIFSNGGGQLWTSKNSKIDLYAATASINSEKLRKTQAIQPQRSVKIKHATLPIVLISNFKAGNSDSIRVLELPDSLNEVTFKMDAFLMVYNHLTKVVDMLHQKILERLDVPVDEKTKRRIAASGSTSVWGDSTVND
ncbi:hypothetical protein PtB15_7B187 [Puccinia triticina]|nr:hypothetical protein PtB15_7B187 [Puccinia triticina]